MKDIYEILNDAKVDVSDIEPVKLSDFEKKRIYQAVTGQKKKRHLWQRASFAAALAGAILLGVGFSPVGAEIFSYFNGNTKTNYVEDIKEHVQNNDVSLEVMNISRNGKEIKIKCKLTFDRDISALEEACREYDKPQGNVLDAPPFQNSTVYVNGTDLKVFKKDKRNEWFLSCRNTEVNGNVLIQTISLYDMGTGSFDDEISIHYKDIVLEDTIIEGEWNYNYVLKEDVYPEDEIQTCPIQIEAQGIDGDRYTMDSYAVTPNGIKVYGTVPDKEISDSEETYPCHATLIRMKARDDLGNEYLMYPRCETEDTEQVVYEIYDGPADREDQYPDEWNPEAASITVALEEEVTTWTSKEEYRVEYQIISEEFTIDLTDQTSAAGKN